MLACKQRRGHVLLRGRSKSSLWTINPHRRTKYSTRWESSETLMKYTWGTIPLSGTSNFSWPLVNITRPLLTRISKLARTVRLGQRQARCMATPNHVAIAHHPQARRWPCRTTASHEGCTLNLHLFAVHGNRSAEFVQLHLSRDPSCCRRGWLGPFHSHPRPLAR